MRLVVFIAFSLKLPFQTLLSIFYCANTLSFLVRHTISAKRTQPVLIVKEKKHVLTCKRITGKMQSQPSNCFYNKTKKWNYSCRIHYIFYVKEIITVSNWASVKELFSQRIYFLTVVWNLATSVQFHSIAP